MSRSPFHEPVAESPCLPAPLFTPLPRPDYADTIFVYATLMPNADAPPPLPVTVDGVHVSADIPAQLQKSHGSLHF